MIDAGRLRQLLLELLAIPSPCGFTDEVIRYIASALEELGIEYQITRRGTIRARLPGTGSRGMARAIVNHVDSIGAMVKRIRSDGRLEVAPIGYWSSRYAEGVRVTLFSEHRQFRGTLLASMTWGTSRDEGAEDLPINWDHIELRLDEPVYNEADVKALGIDIGDFVDLDSSPEVLENGFIVGRNIDNKAGAAAVMVALEHVVAENLALPSDVYFLFTVTESIGTGVGSAILPEVSELLTVDFASIPAINKSPFKRITIAASDANGPYDYHLTAHLQQIARLNDIPHQRKVLGGSHSDAASALAAGHDVRTAVVTYAGDASHSIERTHLHSLINMARLLVAYMVSEPTFISDPSVTTVSDFTHQIDSDNLPATPKKSPDVAQVLNRTWSSDDGSEK
jgi:peptidase M42 family hydrolase